MTITPQYSWRQTGQRVVVTVSLHSIGSRTLDVITTTSYLKASFPPYCLEVFLLHRIDSSLTVTRILDGKVDLVLTKADDGDWESLGRRLDKQAAATERQAAQQRLHEDLGQEAQTKKTATIAAGRHAVSLQLQVDEALRVSQQQLKEQLKRDFFSGQYDATMEHAGVGGAVSDGQQAASDSMTEKEAHPSIRPPATQGSDGSSVSPDRSDSLSSSTPGSSMSSAECRHFVKVPCRASSEVETRCSQSVSPAKDLAASSTGGVRRRVSEEYDGDGEDHYSSTEDVLRMLSVSDSCNPGRKVRRMLTKKSSKTSRDEEREAVLQHRNTGKKRGAGKSDLAVRAPCSIQVQYTATASRVPARAPAPQQAGPDAADPLRLEELMSKATILYERKAYSDCVAAYGAILDTWPRCARAYSNRAAVHLAAGRPDLAVHDASKALSLLDPQCPTTAHSRLLCLSRRGCAYNSLQQLSRALADYEAALALQPDDGQLQRDCEELRRALDTSEGSSWVETEEEEACVLP